MKNNKRNNNTNDASDVDRFIQEAIKGADEKRIHDQVHKPSVDWFMKHIVEDENITDELNPYESVSVGCVSTGTLMLVTQFHQGNLRHLSEDDLKGIINLALYVGYRYAAARRSGELVLPGDGEDLHS